MMIVRRSGSVSLKIRVVTKWSVVYGIFHRPSP